MYIRSLCMFVLILMTLCCVCDAAQKGQASRTIKKKHSVQSLSARTSAATLYQRGKRALAEERYEDAIEHLQGATRKMKANGHYRLALAEAYYKAAYYDDAEQELQQAVARDRSLQSEATYLQGLILYERGEFTAAREQFKHVVYREGASSLGGKARRMERRAGESARNYKEWGFSASSGSETNDNLTTQFQDEYAADLGTITELSLWYRPMWWRGTLLEYASSQIVYQRLSSANISAQMIHIGSDMIMDPLFSYDYIYTYYWLTQRPYYRSDLLKLMCNVHVMPFEYRARTGFFISGEEKYYFPDQYAQYDAKLTNTGIEQTLFSDVFLGSAYYTSSWSDAPENDYRSINYSLAMNYDLLPWFSLIGGYRYEFRSYTDYYGYNRQDMYREPSLGLRFVLWDMVVLSVERRTIDNRSNISEKEYTDNITHSSVAISF